MQTITVDPGKCGYLTAGMIGPAGMPVSVEFSFTRPEKKILSKPFKIRPSRWAPKNRVVTYGPFKGQYWRSDLTPYLDGIMDAAMFASVQEFYLVKGVQTGGSEAIHTCAGWSVEFIKVPILYVYPDQAVARDNSYERIRSMLEKSPTLAQYLSGVEDDKTNYRIRLIHVPIYVGWASSAAQLSNKPIGLAIADETEIYKEEVSSRHADPISEIKDRLTTYMRLGIGKLLALSTPTTPNGPIYAGYNAASIRFELFVPCPACGHEQVLAFSGLTWPRIRKSDKSLAWVDPAADPEIKKDFEHPSSTRLREQNLGRYKCVSCADLWDDARRNDAVSRAVWRDPETGQELMKALRSRRPVSVGMKLPSWPSWFFSLSTGAAAWVEYLRTKDRRKLKHFLNKYCAEPYQDYAIVRAEDKVLALRDDRPAGLVPREAAVLVAGADTQDNGFWYWIQAFGYGAAEESWEIRTGFVDTLEALEQILVSDMYADADGKAYPVMYAVQDAMGHRTAEVYDFCRRHRRRIVPFKGEGKMAAPTAWSKVDVYPGTSKPIPGGLRLLRANVNLYKDKVSGKLEIAKADPGALHLSADFDYDKASHLCTEVIDDKTGLWINPQNRPNHLWDCLVLCFVAAEVAGVKFMRRPAEASTAVEKKKKNRPNRGKIGVCEEVVKSDGDRTGRRDV